MQRSFTLLLLLGCAQIFAQSITWISPCVDKTYCLDPGSCTEGTVNLTENAVTICGNGYLNYSYKIDLFYNGSIDIQSSEDTVNQAFPVGTHEIIWRANDNCGNVSTACRYLFTIKDCNPPNLLCINGLTQNLEFPECEAKFDLNSFILQVNDNCTPNQALDYGMKLVSDTSSAFPTDTSLTFGICEQGLHVLRIFVRDENGLTNQCNSYVLVQNNNGLCSCNIDADLALQGCAHTADSSLLADYTIRAELKGVPLQGQPFTKPFQKLYQDSCYSIDFSDLPLNGAYTGSIRASRAGDPLIGVSTFDLVTINKHILGQQTFTSFFQTLGSDVNQSKTISTFDIIEIRKLILGIYDTFPNVPSWRFILPMPDSNLTAFAAVRDTYAFNVPNLMADTTLKGFDFIGVKMGDANRNASFQGQQVLDRGKGKALQLQAAEHHFHAGESRWIPVYLTENADLDGWQIALQADLSRLKIGNVRGVPPAFVGLNELSELRVSCVYDVPAQLSPHEPLMEIFVTALQATDLSEALLLNKNRLAPEAYSAAGPALRTIQFSIGHKQPDLIISPPHPNPFSDHTVFDLELGAAQHVALELFNLSGTMLYQTTYALEAGSHRLQVPSSALPGSGVFTYRVIAGGLVKTGRLVRF